MLTRIDSERRWKRPAVVITWMVWMAVLWRVSDLSMWQFAALVVWFPIAWMLFVAIVAVAILAVYRHGDCRGDRIRI